ncbi:MFS transporter [Desulfonatronospira sp. MSAO_Bac3]|uniref:MFS transporter n=1 Tax=Desulfonatronospira sp. MSAO_Bac3 TaxID=2293857 RepID=UPI000FF43A84|nr:MFS transporter [Desulfonatronospira sp. MSAO_Bac3]RQD73023.1 MAG: MFS transporter [Desulfonatronospira sp. MSAO_Bac3]
MDLEPRQVRLYIAPLLSLTIFLSVLNGVTFNLAVPDIAADYAVSPAMVSWVVTAYIVIFAFGSVMYARLGQRFHLRDLITAGLLIFCLGSLLGFFTDSYHMLVAARMIQAAGASGIPALSMVLATVYVPVKIRGRLLGLIASTVAFGLGIGPIIGGLIAGYLHWNYLFLMPLLLLPSIYLLRRALPRQSDLVRKPLDLPGALLLAGTVGCLLFMVNLVMWWLLLPALVLGTLFARRIISISYPFVSPELFGSPGYLHGLLTALLAMGTIFATFFLMPLMFRHIYDMPTLHIGLYLFPGAMSAALAGLVAGRFVDRCGAAPVVRTGFLILMTGFGLIILTAGQSPVVSALCLIVANSGFTIIHSSLAGAVSGTLPEGRVGLGMGVFNLVFFVSGAMGTASAGMFLDVLGHDQSGSYSFIFAGCLALALAALFIFKRSFTQTCK